MMQRVCVSVVVVILVGIPARAIHPGKCPPLGRGIGGICVDRCSSDEDCLKHQKCCSNGCGHVCLNVIQPRIGQRLRPHCPPVEEALVGACVEECRSDEECEAGERCCSNGCGHACVNPRKLPSKPGVCPPVATHGGSAGICIDECDADGDCQGSMMCCSNGCGHICTEPVHPANLTKPGRCPARVQDSHGVCPENCVVDSDCPDEEKCCGSECGLVCIDPERAKSGHCPAVPQGVMGDCSEDCTADDDCPEQQECCSNGCGHVCLDPAQPKAGQCPDVPTDLMGTCSEDCSSDSDCDGGRKCCSNGCGHSCMGATPSEPPIGSCPRAPAETGGVCSEECGSDSDCGRDQRCCSNGCGHACMNTVGRSESRPGKLCPQLGSSIGGICSEECASDHECPDNRICCNNGCGHVCMDVSETVQHNGCRRGENYYQDGATFNGADDCEACHCSAGEVRCSTKESCRKPVPFNISILVPALFTLVGVLLTLILLIVTIRCILFRKTARNCRYKHMHEVSEFEPVPGASSRNVL